MPNNCQGFWQIFLDSNYMFIITTDLTSSYKISIFSFLSRLPELIFIEFGPCLTILIARECQKCYHIWKSSNSNPRICITTGLISSTKTCNRKVCTLGGLMDWNTINLDPMLKSWNCNCQKFFHSIIWSHLDFQTRFSPKTLRWVFPLRSQSSVFNFWCSILIQLRQKCYFSSIQWNSEWLEMTESVFGLDMPR